MAEVDLKSTQVTNDDATPAVLTDAILTGARLIETVGHIQTNADDSAGSTYMMVKVPSNARISQVLLSNDNAGSTGDTDVGIYNADGTAKDVDLFADDVDINASANVHTDVTHESGNYGIEDSEKRLWEVLGEDEDPHVDYIVGLTLTEAVTAATDLVVKVRYVI